MEDNFWTWRVRMYDLVCRLTPDDYEAIAAFVYLEMVKFGMTAVGEFHYVHHQPDGSRYAFWPEMSHRLLSAADQVGIGITLLPTFYAHDGVGKPPSKQQSRFVHGVDEFLALFEALQSSIGARCHIGCGIHSLRAASPEEIHQVVVALDSIAPGVRIHIHVSETLGEVEECLESLGMRPVQWLLRHVNLTDRWTLIHATHLDESERKSIAASGVVVGICPATEATLGDGFFPLVEYQNERGVWGIGTDSNYTTSTAEELRILEVGKRQQLARRNIIVDPSDPLRKHSGRQLFDLALAGGDRALGQNTGTIASGRRADIVVLDPENPTTVAHHTDTILDAWILSGTSNPVRDVMIAGRWIVQDGKHAHEREIVKGYKAAMSRLT
jgi:formimidoylglutamate deiminase